MGFEGAAVLNYLFCLNCNPIAGLLLKKTGSSLNTKQYDLTDEFDIFRMTGIGQHVKSKR